MSVVKHTFEFESQSFQLRKTCVYELWVDGAHKFYFSDKSNALIRCMKTCFVFLLVNMDTLQLILF